MASTSPHPRAAAGPFSWLLLLLLLHDAAYAQLQITAITPASPSSESDANTVLVTSALGQALLPGAEAALLWGAVPSSAVIAACELIVNTGQHTFTANITNDLVWGGPEFVTLKVLATGGCLAASDASGTLFSLIDNNDRFSAVVCPSNAGSIGCGVYITGEDVDELFDTWDDVDSRMHLLQPTKLRIPMEQDLKSPIPYTDITGVMSAADCTNLGDLSPFCSPGDLGARTICSCTGTNCCNGNCFPGDALVRTRHGITKPMSQLQLGDQVAVLGDNDAIDYKDVYAFGHKDSKVLTEFIKITTEPTHSLSGTTGDHVDHSTILRLSGDHFIPTAIISGDGHSVLYKRAKDVQVGDIIWTTHLRANGVEHVMRSHVKDISTTWARGLYNPLTLSGTIIVDNVVASSHSGWFMDSAFDTMGLTHWLPMAYQFVLAPVRGLYQVMGTTTYIFLYDIIDAYFDIPTFGTKYGGTITMASLCAMVISVPFISRVVVRPIKNLSA